MAVAAAVDAETGGPAIDLERVRRRVTEDAGVAAVAGVRDGARRVAALRSAVARAVREEGLLLAPAVLASLVRQLADELAGLGPVELLLRDPAVTDVMVNAPGEVWVERDGRLARTDVRFPDAAAVHAAILRVIGPLGLRLDRAQPSVDARLPDGSRLHALLPPLSPAGPALTIRKFAAVAHTWEDLAATGAAPAEVAALLRDAVAARRAMVVCGRTPTRRKLLLLVVAAASVPR
jgi:pilus assembly protein CpaF